MVCLCVKERDRERDKERVSLCEGKARMYQRKSFWGSDHFLALLVL